jgi:hypothetical protein
MFMRANRTINKAPQPETTAASDAPKQRSAKKLSPNFDIPGPPEDWRFTPSMSSCAAINKDHYQGGVTDAGPYSVSYEQHIPHVGEQPVHTEGDRKLGNHP